MKEELIQNWLR